MRHAWSSEVGWQAFQVKAKLIGLCAYEVESVDGMGAIEEEHARRAAQAAQAKAMEKAAMEVTSKRRRTTKSNIMGPLSQRRPAPEKQMERETH